MFLSSRWTTKKKKSILSFTNIERDVVYFVKLFETVFIHRFIIFSAVMKNEINHFFIF